MRAVSILVLDQRFRKNSKTLRSEFSVKLIGKLGGFIGVFLSPIFDALARLAGGRTRRRRVSVLGILVTATLLPETKGKSLEELSADEPAAPALAGAPG